MSTIDDELFEKYVDVSLDLIVATSKVRDTQDALQAAVENTDEFKAMKEAADKQQEILARGSSLVEENPALMELNSEDNLRVLSIADERLGPEYAAQIQRSRDAVEAEERYHAEMDAQLKQMMSEIGIDFDPESFIEASANEIEAGEPSPADSADNN